MQLEPFLRPFYQDLDGVSRAGEVARVARIARMLHTPDSPADARAFELLLHFHLLGTWLEKVGNLSRALLAIDGVTEAELRATAASIRRLDAPQSAAERAVAAAVLIDGGGVRGLAERLARARREGSSIDDVAKRGAFRSELPSWLPLQAVAWLEARQQERARVCQRILDEEALHDL